MKRARVIRLVAIAAVLGAGGWWLFGRNRANSALSASAAHLAVRWRGKYQGTMVLPAKINWCPGTRRGILEAISADSGVAVVLYEQDSLTGGPHNVVSPDPSVAVAPRNATVVMRWLRMGRDTAVTGFRSQSGTVRVSYAGGMGSGDINARMGILGGSDTLVVQGVFRDVPVVTTAAGCS